MRSERVSIKVDEIVVHSSLQAAPDLPSSMISLSSWDLGMASQSTDLRWGWEGGGGREGEGQRREGEITALLFALFPLPVISLLPHAHPILPVTTTMFMN